MDPKKIHRARDAVMKVVQAREVKRKQEEDIIAVMNDARLEYMDSCFFQK